MPKELILKNQIAQLPFSIIARVTATIGTIKGNVINMAMGSPSHPISSSARETITSQLSQGKSSYGSPYGIATLRANIADDINAEYDENLSSKNVIVTAGSAAATYAIQAAMLEKDDVCLIPTPAYGSYAPAVALQHAKLVGVPSKKEDGFQPDLLSMRNAFKTHGDKVRTVIINYPNNPTGAVLTQKTAKKLAELLNGMSRSSKKGFVLMIDDAYKDIHFGKPSHSIYPYLDEDLKNNTVILGSASKLSGLAGERLGHAASRNTKLIDAIKSIMSAVMLSPGTFVQQGYLADREAMLDKDKQTIQQYYAEKSEFVTKRLNAIAKKAGWPKDKMPILQSPQGSIFVFADFSQMLGYKLPGNMHGLMGKTTIESDEDISNYFMHIAEIADKNGTKFTGVASVPGCGFLVADSKDHKGMLRFCIAGDFNQTLQHDNTLKNAMDALEKAVLYIQEINLSKSFSSRIAQPQVPRIQK